MFCAYIHARPDGRPFYVGKGTIKRARRFSGRNKYHGKVVNKYGADNILVGVMECSSEEISFELEKGLIKCFRRSGVKLTNVTDGGEGVSGMKHSESVKESQRQRMLVEAKTNPERFAKLRTRNTGRVQSEAERVMRKTLTLGRKDSAETKARKSAARIGMVFSAEHRAAIGAAFKGKSQSDEHRAKNSAAIKLWWAKRKGGTQNS